MVSGGPVVTGFSPDNLLTNLRNSNLSSSDVQSHPVAQYLQEYLATLGARTIVVEDGYVDGDYLDDFATYYVRCFKPYERLCKRLHFFRADFTREQFLSLVRGEMPTTEKDEIRGAYLGFIVSRPLPGAIIGRTVLGTYDADGGRRNYTCTKVYSANLYGFELTVRSLAFQEQDTVLSACATVALWCCFHKTADLFGTLAPRPAVITRAANVIMHHARPIPSHGLNVQQICNAIAAVALEPEVVEIKPGTPLVSLIYSHLRMGLPVLLGVKIEGVGMHAIALTGYSMGKNRVLRQEVAGPGNSIPMAGLRIDKFYAHDDQFGPFSRLWVKPSAIVQNRAYPVTFEGLWKDRFGGKVLQMFPEVVVIPVYNKIRLTFLDVQKWLTRLNDLVRLLLSNTQDFEWDVHLITTNDYKRSFHSFGVIDAPTVEKVLLTQHPRFIWRCALMIGGSNICELLADATDMSRSLPTYFILWYDARFRSAFSQALNAPRLQSLLYQMLTARFAEFLKAQLN